MIPMLPSRRDNMIAWLAARCDEPNYGKLIVYEFPKEKLVYGPFQIEALINQNTFCPLWAPHDHPVLPVATGAAVDANNVELRVHQYPCRTRLGHLQGTSADRVHERRAAS